MKHISVSKFAICIGMITALGGCTKEEQVAPANAPQPAYQDPGQPPAGYPAQPAPAPYPAQPAPAPYPAQPAPAPYPAQPAPAPGYPAQPPPVQQAPAPAAPAAPPMAQPSPMATVCQNDTPCLAHRCNVAAGKCAFPCQSASDCQPGFMCASPLCVPALPTQVPPAQ